MAETPNAAPLDPAHRSVPAPGPAASRRPGRPRDPAADDAILVATLRLLAEHGYQALSIEAVAAAAGVGRPTVYRRYASKADLVAAALAGISSGPEPDLPASTRPALLELERRAATALAVPGTLTVLGSLLAEASRDRALLRLCRERVFGPRIDAIGAVLARGIAAGELRPGADDQATVDLLFGALLARALLGEPADEAWLERVLDTTISGIAVEPPS